MADMAVTIIDDYLLLIFEPVNQKSFKRNGGVQK